MMKSKLIQIFMIIEYQKEGSHCFCLSTILIYSNFKMCLNYYPQVFQKECKYMVKKKMIRLINDNLEISSDHTFQPPSSSKWELCIRSSISQRLHHGGLWILVSLNNPFSYILQELLLYQIILRKMNITLSLRELSWISTRPNIANFNNSLFNSTTTFMV